MIIIIFFYLVRHACEIFVFHIDAKSFAIALPRLYITSLDADAVNANLDTKRKAPLGLYLSHPHVCAI